MTTYRSKPATVEAMRWVDERDIGGMGPNDKAKTIVAWVNSNGGEARYVPVNPKASYADGGQPRIAVRTISSWAYAAPGHYVVMGNAEFTAGVLVNDNHQVRNFYPCDPETFEQRWEPAP